MTDHLSADADADADVDAVARRAAGAAVAWAETEPTSRAKVILAIADALESGRAALVETAMSETGLARTRLEGELTRTVVQLRLFADTVVEGSHLDVRIDDIDPGFALGARPDIRRYLIPVGPVLNFAASNFPFAFSVAGGDTASALAAGCPVIVKAHPGHPRLSEQTAALVVEALSRAGAPAGTFQLVAGQDAGVALLQHPLIASASFTGSLRAGSHLARIAAERPAPIPFHGELGSVNPAFVTRAAASARGGELAAAFVTSVSGSAGQLCTKPGFLFLPLGHGLDAAIAERAAAVPEHRMLYPGLADGYRARRAAVLATEGVRVIAEGSVRVDDDQQGWVTPTIVGVAASAATDAGEQLMAESFGPLSVIVEYDTEEELPRLAGELFGGELTGSVHVAEGEESAALRELVRTLARSTGRVIFDGWPTGVAVTPAMQHGGPWPATTNSSGTSVGTAASARFLRPVSYQNAPQRMLPPPLQDANPWGVPQRRSPAGESGRWGAAAATTAG